MFTGLFVLLLQLFNDFQVKRLVPLIPSSSGATSLSRAHSAPFHRPDWGPRPGELCAFTFGHNHLEPAMKVRTLWSWFCRRWLLTWNRAQRRPRAAVLRRGTSFSECSAPGSRLWQAAGMWPPAFRDSGSYLCTNGTSAPHGESVFTLGFLFSWSCALSPACNGIFSLGFPWREQGLKLGIKTSPSDPGAALNDEAQIMRIKTGKTSVRADTHCSCTYEREVGKLPSSRERLVKTEGPPFTWLLCYLRVALGVKT